MEDNFTTIYEIEFDIDGYKNNDVSNFVVFKCPIIKVSSFAILIANIQTTVYLGLDTECKKHNYQQIKISIYQNDESFKKPNTYGNRKLIIEKTYLIIDIHNFERTNIRLPYITVIFYLINPILYYLNTTNSYNKLFSDKDTLSVISDYENFLKSMYGEKSFNFIKIGADKNKSSYQYEQMLIRCDVDLLIPQILLFNYKPFKSYAYYFFDDFVINPENTYDITGYLINLDAVDNFKKIDFTKYVPEIVENRLLSSFSINDVFNSLLQVNPSKFMKGSDLQFKYKKPSEPVDVISGNIQNSGSISFDDNRDINTVKSNMQQIQKNPTEQTLIYFPDDINIAIERLEIVKKQIYKKILAINHYYIKNCYPDALSFDCIYNIDPFSKSNYSYIPLSIVNIFKKNIGRTALLSHDYNFQMLQFNLEDK